MLVGVTGCAGFLGSHLVDRLLENGYEVAGVDNLSMGRIENLESKLNHSAFKFVKLDVRDSRALKNELQHCDVIVHLAAYKIPRYGNALQTLLINSEGTNNVLEIAKTGKIKVLLASTSDVYGKNPKVPFNEEDSLVLGPSTIPRWSYAISKLFGEHLSYAYQAEHGVSIVNLRFFGSYGPRHHLSWWGGPQSVFITQILQNQEVTIHGDGKQTRSFTYVEDTIDGIVAALESDRAIGEIFNIGSTKEITILELANLISDICNELDFTSNPLRLKFVPYNSLSKAIYEDPSRRVPDINKAKEILGFEPKIDLTKGLAKTINWQHKIT